LFIETKETETHKFFLERLSLKFSSNMGTTSYSVRYFCLSYRKVAVRSKKSV